ncbi:MAG: hypothetical protein O3C27_10325 [Actinomycetota bacterium]|nr:hypothetical protein [Actinomycetota bacterium]
MPGIVESRLTEELDVIRRTAQHGRVREPAHHVGSRHLMLCADWRTDRPQRDPRVGVPGGRPEYFELSVCAVQVPEQTWAFTWSG